MKTETIYSKLKEPDAEYVLSSLQEAIEYCEESGYWEKGSVANILKETGHVWTPFRDFVIADSLKNVKKYNY